MLSAACWEHRTRARDRKDSLLEKYGVSLLGSDALEVTSFRRKLLNPVTLTDNLYVCACYTSYFIVFIDMLLCMHIHNLCYVHRVCAK